MSEYLLVPGPPPLDEYRRLRAEAGLSPKRAEQADGALANSWAFCHLRSPEGEIAAMGRIIGDGGWYFHISDIATHPEHQRRGLGRRVMEWLIAQVEERAPAGASITLMADPPGFALYRGLGFV
ncbi:GNAT family N-acetyltransferase, partial [Leucobacter sp. M11]|uniref:GNAT family N-acetyltransferase n=1 Tax=Leucobacter sp. M11 TaxID=2993565 RepID=UPI002D7E22A1